MNIPFKQTTTWLLCYLLTVLPAMGQPEKDIDSLISTTLSEIKKKGNPEIVVNNSFTIVERSKSIGYDAGVIAGLRFITEALYRSGEYEKSIEYFKQTSPYQTYLSANPKAHFYLLMTQVENQRSLGFDSLARVQYYEAERVIERERNIPERLKGLLHLYSSYYIVSRGNPDTIFYYLNKAQKIIQENRYSVANQQEQFDNLQRDAMIYIGLGDYYGYSAGSINTDSAFYYYKVARRLLNVENRQGLYDAYVYKSLAGLYEQQGQLDSALHYSLKGMEIYKRFSMKEHLLYTYNVLSDLYLLKNDLSRHREYKQRSVALSDSLRHKVAKGRDLTIRNLVEAKEHQLKQKQAKRYSYVLAAVLLLIAGTYLFFRKFRKTKDREISQKEWLLQQYSTELQEKDQQLEQKRKESFEELTQLAKDNDPQFWTRFQEMYPDFKTKLLKVNSSLKVSELTLCAYLYLGFNSREISTYTFKSLRTIENNRTNTRRRLSVPPDSDFVLWINQTVS